MPLQEHRFVAIATESGDQDLGFYRGRFSEKLCSPFEFAVELLSEKDDIPLEQLLGTSATVRFQLPGIETERHINGIITEVEQLPTEDGFSRYAATIRPWFWLLKLSENCRIFQEKTYPEIIADVFNACGFSDFENRLSNSYKTNDYVVQFNETDFNFVTRILEQEGIYYYFIHENGKHTLVLVDDNHTMDEIANLEYFPNDDKVEHYIPDAVTLWQSKNTARSSSLKLTDYDFTLPTKNLLSQTTNPTTSALSKLQRYRYPGKYQDREQGNNYTKLLMERENARFHTKSGTTNSVEVKCGVLFTLTDHYRDGENQQYMVTSTEIILHADNYTSTQSPRLTSLFNCHFQAIPVTIAYRPQATAYRPIITGPQTAIVVGKSGEEIWTDKYGRIKVKFHWDLNEKSDETSSCWIRVAQTWAGKSWGTIYVPRIGQEVIVEFLDGDPDKPLVIGCVYNGGAMPPYELPANASQSGVKSRSTKGGNGFNELRFEDKKGSEQIFVHAERNQDVRVKNDSFETIGNERHLQVAKNRYTLIKENDHQTVKGDKLIHVTGDIHQLVNSDQITEIKGDMHLTVTGNQNVQCKSDIGFKTANINVAASNNIGLESGMNIDAKASLNINLQAGTTINLKAGSSFISIGPAGVAISGPMVMINSGGAAGPANPGKPITPQKADLAIEAQAAAAAKTTTESNSEKSNSNQTSKLEFSQAKTKAMTPSVQVMRDAAKDGTPFCEICS